MSSYSELHKGAQPIPIYPKPSSKQVYLECDATIEGGPLGRVVEWRDEWRTLLVYELGGQAARGLALRLDIGYLLLGNGDDAACENGTLDTPLTITCYQDAIALVRDDDSQKLFGPIAQVNNSVIARSRQMIIGATEQLSEHLERQPANRADLELAVVRWSHLAMRATLAAAAYQLTTLMQTQTLEQHPEGPAVA